MGGQIISYSNRYIALLVNREFHETNIIIWRKSDTENEKEDRAIFT